MVVRVGLLVLSERWKTWNSSGQWWTVVIRYCSSAQEGSYRYI